MEGKGTEFARGLLGFIDGSPTCFHAAANVARELRANGFTELSERARWTLRAGGRHFVTRNGSSIIAFALPNAADPASAAFAVAASHSDSPCLKVKENPCRAENSVVRLNVEKYGGALLAPWFDRPLSVAGRLAVRSGNAAGGIEPRLVDLRRPVAMIPSLAIHFDRNANDGRKIDVQREVQPILSGTGGMPLGRLVAESAGVDEADVLGTDLFVYNAERGFLWGAEDEFIAAPRLDDLECAWATLRGFLGAAGGTAAIPVHAVFDSEEVGSGTRQGADSSFLAETLRRITLALGLDEEAHFAALARSMLVSADNAHALHPAHADSSDPVNRPLVNGGPVVKLNAAQKYTTDALSLAVFRRSCERAGVPCQIFTNSSNVAGGSTLGNISQSHVSVRSVDVGLAQWAMHSPMESAGALDAEMLSRAAEAFFRTEEFPED